MLVSDWLKPAYENVSEILVVLPISLASWRHDSLLATGNQGTTGTLHDDIWVDETDCCVFASVKNFGKGYVAFIGAFVSADGMAEQFPDNIVWLTNLATLLTREADADEARALSHLRSPHQLFMSHRKSDASFVAAVTDEIKRAGLAVWLDEERLIPSMSLWGEISAAMNEMTHFVLFWSVACLEGVGVTREWQAAAAAMIDRRIPIIIVRLDRTAVPAIMADLFRIEAQGLNAQKVAAQIHDAVVQLAAPRL